MLFRKLIDDSLVPVSINVNDESEFVQQNTDFVSAVNDALPSLDNPSIECVYKLDENGEIAVDEEKTLERYKDFVNASINAMRDDILEKGFTWTKDDVTYYFGLNRKNITMLQNIAIAALLGQEDNMYIIDDNNNNLNLDNESAKDLALYASNYAAQVYANARDLKDKILACDSVDDVDKILKDYLEGDE